MAILSFQEYLDQKDELIPQESSGIMSFDEYMASTGRSVEEPEEIGFAEQAIEGFKTGAYRAKESFGGMLQAEGIGLQEPTRRPTAREYEEMIQTGKIPAEQISTITGKPISYTGEEPAYDPEQPEPKIFGGLQEPRLPREELSPSQRFVQEKRKAAVGRWL